MTKVRLARLLALGVLLTAGVIFFLRDESPPSADAPVDPTTSSEVLGPTIERPEFEERPSLQASRFGGVTREVGSVAEWNSAVAATNPGDEIRLVANIDGWIRYWGPEAGSSNANGRSGTEALPILISAAPGVWIDSGSLASGRGALDVRSANHIWVEDLNIRNAEFGIRFLEVRGTASSPSRVTGSYLERIGDACIAIGGDPSTFSPSQHVLLDSNEITGCGSADPRFGEAVYLGYGKLQWHDQTSHVTVSNNTIHNVGSEAVDIKTGTTNISVVGNDIYDVGGVRGGVITAHYALEANPRDNIDGNILIASNRIWNINLDNRSVSNDWTIWVGQGGVEIRDNIVWGQRDTSAALAVRVRAEADFGSQPIIVEDNVFWAKGGWASVGQPSGTDLIESSGNVCPQTSDLCDEAIPSAEAPGFGDIGAQRGSGGRAGNFFVSYLGDSGPAPPTTTTSTVAPTTTSTVAPTTTSTPSTTSGRRSATTEVARNSAVPPSSTSTTAQPGSTAAVPPARGTSTLADSMASTAAGLSAGVTATTPDSEDPEPRALVEDPSWGGSTSTLTAPETSSDPTMRPPAKTRSSTRPPPQR